MKVWKWLVAASATALWVSAPCAAQTPPLPSEWSYVPMNTAAQGSTPAGGDVLAPALPAAANVVCRTGGPSGVAVRGAPVASKRLVIVMQGGGACINKKLCDDKPGSFSYDEFSSLRGAELNYGIFFRHGTENPFKDYHQAFIPYCSGDMHAGNVDRVIQNVTGVQKFRGYANTALYFDELLERFRSVLVQPGAEVMLLGQSAGGYGAAFNLPVLRDKLRAVAPGARLIFVSESAPLLEETVGAPCLTQTWRTFFNYDNTFLGTCPTCTSTNWLVEWHEHMMRKTPDVSHALFAAELDFVVKQLMEASWMGPNSPLCAGATNFSYERFKSGLRSARSRMQSAIWRGTPTATYFVTNPLWNWYHMFITYPWYYSQQESNIWGRQVKLNEWLPGLFDAPPDFGDHVGFP